MKKEGRLCIGVTKVESSYGKISVKSFAVTDYKGNKLSPLMLTRKKYKKIYQE